MVSGSLHGLYNKALNRSVHFARVGQVVGGSFHPLYPTTVFTNLLYSSARSTRALSRLVLTMKQLRPKTILAVGIVGSLVLNLIAAASVFSLRGVDISDWKVIGIIAGTVWIFLGVPTFIGMAAIRYRIDRSKERHQKVKTAITCCTSCCAIAVAGILTWYLNGEPQAAPLPFVKMASFLVTAIASCLAILTGINMLIRTITNGWKPEVA